MTLPLGDVTGRPFVHRDERIVMTTSSASARSRTMREGDGKEGRDVSIVELINRGRIAPAIRARSPCRSTCQTFRPRQGTRLDSRHASTRSGGGRGPGSGLHGDAGGAGRAGVPFERARLEESGPDHGGRGWLDQPPARRGSPPPRDADPDPTDERVPHWTTPPRRRSASRPSRADRVTGERHEFDPASSPSSAPGQEACGRTFRAGERPSPKLNEMMREEGQPSRGLAQPALARAPRSTSGSSFRTATRRHVPAVGRSEIRDLGWDGGVGVYPTKHDWFVHADVGKNRRWPATRKRFHRFNALGTPTGAHCPGWCKRPRRAIRLDER